MATTDDTRAATAYPSPASPFELIERLRRLSDKLDVAASRFREAEENETLPEGLTGEVFITVDVAEELANLACDLDDWARANGASETGRLTEEV